jgi:hypothetical protein
MEVINKRAPDSPSRGSAAAHLPILPRSELGKCERNDHGRFHTDGSATRPSARVEVTAKTNNGGLQVKRSICPCSLVLSAAGAEQAGGESRSFGGSPGLASAMDYWTLSVGSARALGHAWRPPEPTPLNHKRITITTLSSLLATLILSLSYTPRHTHSLSRTN